MKPIAYSLLLFLSAAPVSLLAQEPDSTITKNGMASYYASYFEGRKTSNGEVYRHKKFTAAHLTLPFGSEVIVTNPSNGKSVKVRINDRGPHSKRLMIDLSQAAAKEIGLYGKGVGKVELNYKSPY